MVLISGDAHCSLNSIIYHKNKKLFKNYITSGLTNSTGGIFQLFKIDNIINNIVNNPIINFILNNIITNSEYNFKYTTLFVNKNYLLLKNGQIIQKKY